MKFCGYDFSEPTSNLRSSKVIGNCVYLIIFDGEIKYVGATSRLYKRLTEHKCRKFKGVDFKFSYLISDDAFKIEHEIINSIETQFNIVKSYFVKRDNIAKCDMVKVKIYMNHEIKRNLDIESMSKGETISSIVTKGLIKELKRRGSK